MSIIAVNRQAKIFDIQKEEKQRSEAPFDRESEAVIGISLSFSYCNKELKFSFKAKKMYPKKILFNDLIDQLEKHMDLKNHTISYCTKEEKTFYHCGMYPLEKDIWCELTPSKELCIRLRQNMELNHHPGITPEEEENDCLFDNEDEKKKNHFFNHDSKRAKERLLKEVLEALVLWKDLYMGITTKEGKVIKFTLDEAAKRVNISKKSLDEYYSQIKLGHQYGFDFNAYKNHKIGFLRSFVKQKRQEREWKSTNVFSQEGSSSKTKRQLKGWKKGSVLSLCPFNSAPGKSLVGSPETHHTQFDSTLSDY